jgi:hypothetical protein
MQSEDENREIYDSINQTIAHDIVTADKDLLLRKPAKLLARVAYKDSSTQQIAL